MSARGSPGLTVDPAATLPGGQDKGPDLLIFVVYRWFDSDACNLSLRARMVLGVIANHGGAGDTAYPGEERIARQAGTSTRTVRRGVAELRDEGLIEVKRRPGDRWGSRSNMYRVNRAMIDGQLNSTRLTDGSSSNPTGQIGPLSSTQQGNLSGSTGHIGHTQQDKLARELPSSRTTQMKRPFICTPDGARTSASAPNPSRKLTYPEDFTEFWEEYPRKVGKCRALEAWEGTADYRPPLPELLALLREFGDRQVCSDFGKQGIPYPATWLRDHRWEDEP